MARGLTARSIKRITPPTAERGPQDHVDRGASGLYLTVRPSGLTSWTLRYRVAGVGKRFAIGPYPNVSISAARKRAHELQQKLDARIDLQVERNPPPIDASDAFAAQADRFVETYARHKNKTWRAQARWLGLALANKAALKDPTLKCEWTIVPNSPADRWRDRTVASITKREIADAVDAITEERGKIAANRTHATLTRLFSWAVEKGLVKTSEALGTKAPNPEKSRDRVLTPEELSAIWWAAEKLRPPFGAFVRLILTGARRNEIAGMTEVEIVRDVWTLPAPRSKTGEANALPLPPQALELISELPRNASGLLLWPHAPRKNGAVLRQRRHISNGWLR